MIVDERCQNRSSLWYDLALSRAFKCGSDEQGHWKAVLVQAQEKSVPLSHGGTRTDGAIKVGRYRQGLATIARAQAQAQE
jgi:hypothetical protein